MGGMGKGSKSASSHSVRLISHTRTMGMTHEGSVGLKWFIVYTNT